MSEQKVILKPINEIKGMNFFIPNYQRGYRWEPQQATDLLNDIKSFMEKKNGNDEIYCIQPLVVQLKDKEEEILNKIKEAKTLEDVEKCMKGTWNVIDGQQRLTTIYLILKALSDENEENLYEIDYDTRTESRGFLERLDKLSENEENTNIDFYHIYNVYKKIGEWLERKDDNFKENFKEILLNKVHFIWYQIDKKENPISVFTRLNIGKIPLTNSELIKALFLNRTNFDVDKHILETKQIKISTEWDTIERTLQNDEFWLFIHKKEYSKPTRIDYILDMIAEKDKLKLKKNIDGKRSKNKKNKRKENEMIEAKIGNDDYSTFRYFYEVFNKECEKEEKKNEDNIDWVDEIWSEIKKYYQIFCEWYHDYRMFHYVGYLSTVTADDKSDEMISELVDEWGKNTKEDFVDYLKKDKISKTLQNKKWIKDRIKEWVDYEFDSEGNASKTECKELLLLHNVETIVQQNEKLVSDTKYNLPNFSKFPFHLYKSEKWQVEHIRPNAGDNFTDDKMRNLYLLLAKKYISNNKELCKKIDNYIDGKKEIEFEDILKELNEYGGSLSDEHKNKICNYTLLDESTNKEYGNAIFPVKRAFISYKEQGYKPKFKVEKGELKEDKSINEIAFVPPCTRNVFSKFYTISPTTMIAWTKEDAKAYLNDMKDKIGKFISGEFDNKEGEEK